MKARCINTDGWSYRLRLLWIRLWQIKTTGPKLGDIVTVTGEDYYQGEKYYNLLEWPGNDDSYLASCFEPLEEQYEKVKLEEIRELASVN